MTVLQSDRQNQGHTQAPVFAMNFPSMVVRPAIKMIEEKMAALGN